MIIQFRDLAVNFHYNNIVDSSSLFLFNRPRINKLLTEAVRFPVVVICAGAGYGKTSAVHDFLEGYDTTAVWIQLSDRDNVGARFWENFSHSVAQVNMTFSRKITELGFPDTKEKINRYLGLLNGSPEIKQRIIIFDDFHCIEDPAVLRFAQECILAQTPPGISTFLITRTAPSISITGPVLKGHLFNIDENDLRFTENELAQYFSGLGFPLEPAILRTIMQDTEGWVFAINLIARSCQKAPGYEGYVRNAVKINIFRLMETEIWDGISGHMQDFLVCLSLIDHLSFDLIALLAGKDEELISGLEKHNAYIRRDSYTHAYLIHPLFLEFLSTKQELLSEKQKHETYTIAGDWCNRNGFKIDALSYHEKTGDYGSIVSICFTLPVQIPENIAKFMAVIFDRTPAEAFDTVEFLAVMHLRSYMCLCLWDKAIKLAQYYEKRFLSLDEDNIIRKRTLSRLYYSWSYLRNLMCTMDDCYDFDLLIEKSGKHLSSPAISGKYPVYSPGPWINFAGSSRKGSCEEFIVSLTRKAELISQQIYGYKTGEDELARGELKFYQGDAAAAEPFVASALEHSRKNRELGIMHMALFYTLRICITQGNYAGAEQAIKDAENLLEETEYSDRYTNQDIILAWYYYILGLPEKIPEWLKEDFSPYGHAGFTTNFANQMKARFCYMTRNYPPLLSYIEEMKHRESILYGRIEMLAMEACTHYKMKNKSLAFAVLHEAYETASPNEIVMPFIELGKDMRTLAGSALKEKRIGIPNSWLDAINRRATSYAKRQAHVISSYRKEKRLISGIILSPREAEILKDLSQGLSRSEIAAKCDLSINTVKMVINNIYYKMGAKNLADLIRIAVEQKMI